MTAKKRQRQQHDELWNLFVEACGGRCCVCRGEGKLQRGHIKRHADGGGDELSNLLPVCKPCNGKYTSTLLTPADGRPVDWKARFAKLIIQHLGLGIRVCTPYEGCAHPNGNVSIENSKVIPPQEVVFEADFKYLPPTTHTTIATPEQLTSAVDQLVRLGRKHKVEIPMPLSKTRDSLLRLAAVHGIPTFLEVGREFLATGSWFSDEGDRVSRLQRGHEWEGFSANFSGFQGDLADRRIRDAEEKATYEPSVAASMAEARREAPKVTIDPTTRLDAGQTVKERNRKLAVARFEREFTEAAQGLDTDDDKKASAFYAARSLLREMKNCPVEDFPALAKRFAAEMKEF